MNWHEIVGKSLMYLIAGMLYSVLYTLIFKPRATDAYLGLMILGWPFWIIIEIALTLAKGIGTIQRTILERLNERIVAKVPAAQTRTASTVNINNKPAA